MTATVWTRPRSELTVHTEGILPTDTAELIRDRLAPVLGPASSYGRVRVTRLCDPRLQRPVVAQVDLNLPERRVRAQVAAPTLPVAALLLAARTAAQLRRVPGRGDGRTTSRAAAPGRTWSPELRPPTARTLARNKVCSPAVTTVAGAVRDLEALDYDFHYFREQSTGQDSIVCRCGPGAYRLIQLDPRPGVVVDLVLPLTVDRVPAPWRTVPQAIAHLDLTGRSFEFFADTTTGRGRVLYTRYDGHYGLITPSEPLWLADGGEPA
ncbi:MAG TPA: sigma 54 modulation/S30EA ribosomal C-terminal domain-containing protein [Kribbella sp.]|nr:sigma 54 modulation/S30EA ribosomal C-terminal domain-containing protein [Kribbella sp.]